MIKKTAFGSLILLLIVMAIATMVEKWFGTDTAHAAIYGSPWFVALWGICGVVSLVYVTQQLGGVWRRKWRSRMHKGFGVRGLHIAFFIILLGAFITYLTADRGYVHIRQGEKVHFYISEESAEKRSLPFDIKLLLFDIEYHAGTDEPADYISFLKVNDEVQQVSMNKILKRDGYRFYQMDFDPDEMGTTLLVSHDPWGIGITYTGYFLLGLAMIVLLFQRIGWKGVLAVLVPLAGLWYYISQINPMTPVLRSPMLAAHVSVIMLSYVLLLAMMVFSIAALSSKRLSHKFYRWNTALLYPAVFFLATGIFIGAVWANISWGRYWGWDAKETWALITLLVYALPFHKTSWSWFRHERNFHWFCVIAFLTILMTFFGVSYVLGGIHSYV
ncbi:MAG: Cytochrome c biogenesis protein CcsA [Candidatus Ordinivivax streblomastigis]|uniref:Cytochrome c biogenesis protein CcsA n=1 Tax=Candidatus Ordinivivax streblomastigis TaxID=2540710 RepID=A0A5M8P2I8_9BACT|nr:MAG: Cytochrome c biogenesis protein CcsA [Candidatus Ordinivivax streblomastigis]